MTFTPEEERWLIQTRRTSQRSLVGGVLFALFSVLYLYDACLMGLTHKLPDGTVVLTVGLRDLLSGTGFLYVAFRSFYPSPSDRLLVSLAERLRSRGRCGELKPALERTPTGDDAVSESNVLTRR